VRVLVIAKTAQFELRSAATGRVVDEQQAGFPFGRPQWRCHDVKRSEHDEGACRPAPEVLSARGQHTSPQDSYRWGERSSAASPSTEELSSLNANGAQTRICPYPGWGYAKRTEARANRLTWPRFKLGSGSHCLSAVVLSMVA
jgi:hypothetical protein